MHRFTLFLCSKGPLTSNSTLTPEFYSQIKLALFPWFKFTKSLNHINAWRPTDKTVKIYLKPFM